ncbi:SDR family NAD(P)-dependent oxidoreductase [Herbaspirillum sp. WKF16]|uniref:SDR family oxidoreductase n=1 Tax=Herbaspirillum sp. WKF16 TaxID=3028312 RepID=UPI0023A9997C|nr:SDR family NAD(P)-dependent oxidoreductase [Herbaspirillum sp. WKF16]WDZ94133.1 SDR family NAD(P)-dependent oxidoreductase [Herbaspirillum sp. WKF16]
MKLTGNTILITGGTSGIGRALAEALHDRGNRVIVTGRRQSLLDQISAARPGLTALQLDLGDAAAVRRFAGRMRDDFPGLNVLVANAGVSRSEDLSAADWNMDDAEAIVQTNILGVLRVAAAILPQIKDRSGAAFLATSSALAFVPRADFPTYCASKAFLHSWLQSLRHQMRHCALEVLELSPPYVRTALTGVQQLGDPRAMPLEDYIADVFRLLETGPVPRGEILLERDLPRRWAERDGAYDAIFSAMNPAR